MPVITGSLKDFGLGSLAARSPVLVFTPSAVGVDPTGRIYPMDPVEAVPAPDDTFSATVARTTNLLPEVFLRLAIRYESGDGPPSEDLAGIEIRVPEAGGNVKDLMRAPVPNGRILIADSEAEAIRRGARLWIDNSTNPARLKRRAS
ncbi:hypothetical protein N1031_06970 [Herbiconiux moechotypicola]|uniref:Uncharacterized protein n=1 Tax=Herbiconiux moechotypicola TaxID=637393 RepID=A0ABP5QE48_9MICO|nr:hypothetical protein [Herbiconiux moechotypicola]MCS5729498.1 hypothetical protein [Herbiconiux moechotypicola]